MNNSQELEISVIIPVYNAARFVTKAVESALSQPETAEIILIEDGSQDNALAVCQDLVGRFDKVRLLRHPDGKNHGAGASRNLGMRNAHCDYIAFLDADDYFLPARFTKPKEIFEGEPDCGGVYEAVGTYIEDEFSMQRWIESNEMRSDLITMTESVRPEDLLEKLVFGLAGYFSLDGLVIKRNVLDLAGYMNESLRLHQDNDFIYRCAGVARLLPGRLNEPVSIRRVHSQNRITSPRSQKQKDLDRMKMWKATYQWFRIHSSREKRNLIVRAIVKFWTKKYSRLDDSKKYISRELKKRVTLITLPFSFREFILEPYYWLAFLPAKLKKKYY